MSSIFTVIRLDSSSLHGPSTTEIATFEPPNSTDMTRDQPTRGDSRGCSTGEGTAYGCDRTGYPVTPQVSLGTPEAPWNAGQPPTLQGVTRYVHLI